MSRRRSAGKRKIAPDTRYNSVVVAKFINFLMQRGKKGVAELRKRFFILVWIGLKAKYKEMF